MSFEHSKDFETLLEYVRDSRGFDFSGYKRNTLVRRVTRRCTELGMESFSAYQDYLQVHPDEFAILFDTILINVTDFFRDREAWDFLAGTIVPQILEKNSHIRVWSTGAASGEEAYSAAIMFCEALGTDQFLDRVKIYATDVDEQALAKARGGYTAKELESLDEDYRARYFELTAGRYGFRQSLRRALIFGRHDLMVDAPISRLDLLICRNTLMYFTSEAQGRILARFHYALNDDGFLFLGRAEMLLTHASLFAPVDLKHRVFTKVPRLQLRDRLLLLAEAGNGDATQVTRQIRLRALAAEGNPNPQLIVDVFGVMTMANHAARRLFDLGPADIGRQFKDLEVSYKPVNLRSPIDQLFRDKRVAALSGIEHWTDGAYRRYDVQLVPLLDDDASVAGASINFIDVTQVAQLRTDLERSKQEVETAYEELQSGNEELETTNEELQSTVEELETTNEELQSSNEELETANEELETTNSELQAINNEMRSQSEEIRRLNQFLHAITGTIPIGAIVLDPELTIQVWNEQATEMWGLRPDEVVGESIFSLDIGLPVKELRTMLRAVSRGKQASDERELEATNRRGKAIRCRVTATSLPGTRKPGGVVMLVEEVKNAKGASGSTSG